jgi:signal transduction histidine kinase
LASLHEILNTLLDVSKLDAGAVIAEPRHFSAERLFSRIDDAFGAISKEKGLRFKLYFPIKDITLNTDPNLLFILLRNLIDNAIKYTATGGVLVGIRRRGESALIQVWDTGIGIPEANHQSIFDEYVQLANPERDKAKGLGLGLSIVERLASLLGTEVHVRSLKDKGSVFELTITSVSD